MVEPKVNRLFGIASPILNHPLTTLLPWVERATYDDLPNPHSLVSGLTESIATNKAMMKIRGKRAFVISRSSFPSSGAHSGHWSGESCVLVCMCTGSFTMQLSILLKFDKIIIMAEVNH